MSRGRVQFACECGRPLRYEYVEAVVPGGVMGMAGLPSVIVSFQCECNPGKDMTRRYCAYAGAIEDLTRGQGVPYRNPCPLAPVANDHPDLRAWRYLLDRYCHDVEVFIAELNRP